MKKIIFTIMLIIGILNFVFSQQVNYAKIEKRNIISLIKYHRVDSIFNTPIIYFAGWGSFLNIPELNFNGLNTYTFFKSKIINFISPQIGVQTIFDNFFSNKSFKPAIDLRCINLNLFFYNGVQNIVFQNAGISFGYYKQRGFISMYLLHSFPLLSSYLSKTIYGNKIELTTILQKNLFDSYRRYYTNNYFGLNLGYSIKQHFDITLTYQIPLNLNIPYYEQIEPDFKANLLNFRLGFNYYFL